MKVMITVKNGWAAQSNSIQPAEAGARYLWLVASLRRDAHLILHRLSAPFGANSVTSSGSAQDRSEGRRRQ